MSDLSEKVINELLKRVSNLEWEVESQQNVIDAATDYVLKARYSDNIDSRTFFTELLYILGKDEKNKEGKRL